MSTSSHIWLSPQSRPELAVSKLTDSSARIASEVLQENHDKHHIFYNKNGFHNHIVHHILTVYALGADSATLKQRYDENANYQLPAKEVDDTIVEQLSDRAVFQKTLGPGNGGQAYSKFLPFFKQEIADKGWEAVLNEYLLAGDERADDMLVRMHSGFLHPMIQLGFGVEFEQPAIIAEAFAEAAAHDDSIGPLLLDSEKKANEAKNSGKPSKPLMQLLDEVLGDEVLTNSTTWKDSSKIKDGIMKRAPEQMMKHLSQVFIRDGSELEKRTAEMIQLCAYFTAASQRRLKQIKFDFFLIHAVNCGIFYTRLMNLPSLSTASKIRLLEWKIRNDLVLFVSRHSPTLNFDDITEYKPQKPVAGDPWPSLYDRVVHLPDDGHASKLIRAFAHGKKTCIPFENDQDLAFKIKGDLWDTISHMAIDSVEADGPTWVRGAGWEEAWKDIPDRKARL